MASKRRLWNTCAVMSVHSSGCIDRDGMEGVELWGDHAKQRRVAG